MWLCSEDRLQAKKISWGWRRRDPLRGRGAFIGNGPAHFARLLTHMGSGVCAVLVTPSQSLAPPDFNVPSELVTHLLL